MARETNKTQLVLEHLIEHGSITSWEAIEMYGATRLSAIIFNLRKHYLIETMIIEFVDRYGNVGSYAKYIYHGKVMD